MEGLIFGILRYTLLAYKSNKACDVTELQLCNNNYDPLMTLL